MPEYTDADALFARRVLLGALLGRTHRPAQVVGRVHQADMRKALREIADQASLDDIVFFGQKAQVVAQP
ncbi:hypothetical protein D3C71_1778440 [compost metagenome]